MRSAATCEKIAAIKKAQWAAGIYDSVDFGNGVAPADPAERAARRAFSQHRNNAARRGIDWSLTFEQWLGIWDASGKWELRGRRRGQYCLSRYGDTGPYAAWNVFVNLSEVNVGDGSRGLKRTKEQNAARSEWMRGNVNGSGLRWVSKNGESRHVKQAVADALLADGWSIGRAAIRRRP